MRQFVYVSTAVQCDEKQLAQILESSVRNNARDDITGFLIYNGRNFFQYVEGDDAQIDDLVARLRMDGRHTGITVLCDSEIEERCMPTWSMRQLVLLQAVDERRRDLGTHLPEALDPWVRRLAINFAVTN